MLIARVLGPLVASQKHEKLSGGKLLLVQPTLPDGTPRGVPLLSVDAVGAGVGERVLVVIEGRSAGQAVRRKAAPVDAAIVGIIDRVTIDEASVPGGTAPKT